MSIPQHVNSALCWRVAAHTQAGLAHEQAARPNEDAVASAVSPDGVLALAVADGVGSGERGDLASSLVAKHWVSFPSEHGSDRVLSQAAGVLSGCEEALACGLLAAGQPEHASSGSMLVGAWLFASGEAVIGHVGDCRAYRLHRDELLPLTRDHSYQNLGLLHPAWRKPGDPARVIGGGMMGPPDVQRQRFTPGDCLLLCSDGLHAALSQPQLAQALRQVHAPAPPSDCYRKNLLRVICQHLAHLAVRAGGRDDISIALACFEGSQGQASEAREMGGEQPLHPRLQKDAPESVWPSDVLRDASS